jgi:hypothetical protein
MAVIYFADHILGTSGQPELKAAVITCHATYGRLE